VAAVPVYHHVEDVLRLIRCRTSVVLKLAAS
jgi:hypothetical protein